MTLLSICRRVAAADWEALVTRISALENSLASGVIPTVSVPVQRKYSEEQPPASVQLSVRQPSAPKPVVQEIKPAAESKTASSGVTKPVFTGSANEEAGKIWAAILKELLADGKRSVHACISQGEILQLDEHQAIVGFAAKFSKERSEREDFRAIIEKVMAHVCGRPVRLQCVLGNSETSLPPAAEHVEKTNRAEIAAPKTEKAAAVSAEHPAVREALQMFGGKIIKE